MNLGAANANGELIYLLIWVLYIFGCEQQLLLKTYSHLTASDLQV